MSNYQRFNSKEPSGKLDEYIHNTCSACGGHGWEYSNLGFPLHTIPCSKCKGTGLGNYNRPNLTRVIVIVLILIGIGFGICKLLNI